MAAELTLHEPAPYKWLVATAKQAKVAVSYTAAVQQARDWAKAFPGDTVFVTEIKERYRGQVAVHTILDKE